MPNNKKKTTIKKPVTNSEKKDNIVKKSTTTSTKKKSSNSSSKSRSVSLDKTKKEALKSVPSKNKKTSTVKKASPKSTNGTKKSSTTRTTKTTATKTTKKVPKFSTIAPVKEETSTKNNKKKTQKEIKVDSKVVEKKETPVEEKKNFLSRFSILKNKKVKSVNKKGNLKKTEKGKESSKKKEKTEKIKKKDKKKKSSTKNNSVFFTKKTKCLILIVVSICFIVLLLEGAYFIYHKIDNESKITYYDSLNATTIDDFSMVSVGSSNFKYSKYNDYTKGLEKAKLIKYDKNGDIVFEKMYENGINTTFNSIITIDDGYIVVGSGEFSEAEQAEEGREAIIVKYDKEGNLVWEKFYRVLTNTRFNQVIATEDGYIAVGQSIYANMELGNHTTGGGIIVKYDTEGNVVWFNNHGGMKSGNFHDVVEVNGDFYVAGKDGMDSGNLVKFNKDGEYQWHKNYSYTDEIGFTGIAYLDNNLYLVGSKKILPDDVTEEDDRKTTNTDALFVKYDLDGKVVFEKTFGGSKYERYNSIIARGKNLYIVGHTTSKDAGLKIDSDGELMTGIVLKYDKDGNILKKDCLGGSNNDNLTDITTDSINLYITGYSNSGDGNLNSGKSNGKDYFGKVIKLDFKFKLWLVK